MNRSSHFMPGTFVVMDNRTYAVFARVGEHLLLIGEHESGWTRPYALAWDAKA